MLLGYIINWDKSVLLPLDNPSLSMLREAPQVKIVSSFQYLGIMIHSKVENYLTDNLSPILTKFQHKSTAWTKVPLSVVGRANLIKMIWAPQLLYIFHNSPIWIPLKWFKKI